MSEAGRFMELSESDLNENREDARGALQHMRSVTSRVLKTLDQGEVSGHTIEVHFDLEKGAPGGEDRDEFIVIRDEKGNPVGVYIDPPGICGAIP